MRRTLAVLVCSLALLAPTPAYASRSEVLAAHPPVRCLRGPLKGYGEVVDCWLPLLKTCKEWPAYEMAGHVWRESRGWPKARNKTGVRVRGRGRLHAYGLAQQLGQKSSNPRIQIRDACALARNAKRAGKPWWRPWAATRGGRR